MIQLLVPVVQGSASAPASCEPSSRRIAAAPSSFGIGKINPRGSANSVDYSPSHRQSRWILADAVVLEQSRSTPGWSGTRKLSARSNCATGLQGTWLRSRRVAGAFIEMRIDLSR